jgi:hypothetical protein
MRFNRNVLPWSAIRKVDPCVACSQPHTRNVITSMAPHFLVDGKKLPIAKTAELMERWTHVLEEADLDVD